MACGVHLGILLIFLIQAEHVCCLWAAQPQRLNSNTYVGFSQQDNEFGGRHPQNKLRQASISPASAQSSSFNTNTAVSSGYSRGLSSRGFTQSVSQPAKSGFPSVKLVQSSLASKPNWRPIKRNQVNTQKMPKNYIVGLSTAIASGSSVSQYDQNPSSKKRPRPVQQGTAGTSKYPTSSSASLQSPSRGSYSFKPSSHQSTAQKATAVTPAYYGQNYPPSAKSSGLFSAGSSVSNKSPVWARTSASAPAKRVSSNNGYVVSKPLSIALLQSKRTATNPSKTGAGKPYQSKLFSVNAGNQASYKPATTSHMASNRVTGYSQSLPVSNKHSPADTGFQPRSLKTATSYTSTGQIPSSMSSLQATWNSRNSVQGPHNLPASGSSRAGTSGQKFAPTRIHNIPQRFGGHAIRRLKEPDQKVSVGKPQQAYVAPQQPAAPQAYVAPQTYVAPQRPMAPQKPAAPQAYVAPQKPAAPQAYVAPQKPVAPQKSAAPQAYVAPQQQTESFKPQVQSVHQQSKWMRIRPNFRQ